MPTKDCIIDGGRTAPPGLQRAAGEPPPLPPAASPALQPAREALRGRRESCWRPAHRAVRAQPPSGCTAAIAEREGQLEVAQLHPRPAQPGDDTREGKLIAPHTKSELR